MGIGRIGRWSLLAALTASMATAQTGTLEWKSEGLTKFIGGFMPHRIVLTDTKPDGIKTLPDGLTQPKFHTIAVGDGADKQSFTLVFDYPAEGPRLWVDAKGTGELALATSYQKPTNPQAAAQLAGQGSFELQPRLTGKTVTAKFNVYQFNKSDARKDADQWAVVYGDGGLSGKLKIGDKDYTVWVVDNNQTFKFSKPTAKSGVMLLIDRNGDGKLSGRSEQFDAGAPFNLDGTTYEIADLTGVGGITIAKSAVTVPEIKTPPNLAVGQIVPSFQVTTLNGTKIKFPDDYKGKAVMLDFWATWCGPCMAELPNVVATYEKYHDKGLEILGVSFDKENMAEKLKNEFLPAHKMTWEQVYDGKYWSTEIGTLYGIEGIPAMFLVEGGTGKILASSPRGPALPKAVEAALAPH